MTLRFVATAAMPTARRYPRSAHSSVGVGRQRTPGWVVQLSPDGHHDGMAYSVVRDFRVGGQDLRLHSSGVGPPVVMLHALASSAASFESAASELIAGGREVVALDLPGHGGSGPVRGSELAGYVEAVVDALAEIDPGPLDLVGHDFGGYLALCVASHRPDRVRALVVEEPAVPPRSGRAPATIVPTSMKVRSAVTVLRQGRHGLSRVRTVADQLRAADPAWWDALGSITAPVLVIDGGSGIPHNGADLEALTAAIPEAKRASLSVGPRPHQVAPDEFAALVLPFLAG